MDTRRRVVPGFDTRLVPRVVEAFRVPATPVAFRATFPRVPRATRPAAATARFTFCFNDVRFVAGFARSDARFPATTRLREPPRVPTMLRRVTRVFPCIIVLPPRAAPHAAHSEVDKSRVSPREVPPCDSAAPGNADLPRRATWWEHRPRLARQETVHPVAGSPKTDTSRSSENEPAPTSPLEYVWVILNRRWLTPGASAASGTSRNCSTSVNLLGSSS